MRKMSVRRLVATLMAAMVALFLCGFAQAEGASGAVSEATATTPAVDGAAAASIPEDAELEAEYAAENGYQFLTTDPEGVYPEIINFKARLRELGFYTAGVDDGTLQTSVLDPLTMAAVNEVCRLNPQFSYHPSGVSRLMYWNVMNMYGYGDDLKTPLSGDYRALEQGAEGEAVTAVQNRLTELGYDSAAGYTFTPGVYDEGLQAAVEAFARVNNMTMDAQTGISAALQKRLFAEDAAPYAPGEGGETLSTAQRILDYFASPSSLMGLSLPNGVLWGVGFILVCVIVVLLVRLLSPGSVSAGKASPGSAVTPGSAPGRLARGEMVFTVDYNGKTCVYREQINNYVRIGRATDKFPLDLSDKGISRKHCEIYMKAGKLMLRDFSSNGTFVNGELCHHAERALYSGDMLKVGDHRITVQFSK